MNTVTQKPEPSILEVFVGDHDRLEAILDRAISACRALALRDARMAFYAYADGVRRRIRIEDETLFPALEAHAGPDVASPTLVMRREHREIERQLDLISDALDGLPDLAAAARQLLALRDLLAAHDRRDDWLLYPACDRSFTKHERGTALEAASCWLHCASCGWPQPSAGRLHEVVFCNECRERGEADDDDELGVGD